MKIVENNDVVVGKCRGNGRLYATKFLSPKIYFFTNIVMDNCFSYT